MIKRKEKLDMDDFNEIMVKVESIKRLRLNEDFVYRIENDKTVTLTRPESQFSPKIKEVRVGDELIYSIHGVMPYIIGRIRNKKGNLLYSMK